MTAPPNPPLTPSITSPINPYTPAGPTGYGSEPTDFGSEPTGTPSGGMSVSYHQSLFSTKTCFMLLLAACIYI
ncbi:hypothetical protein Leryth_027214 [Lithospermum erythrorhizon]|nr:hypothetical protein Leryth_027214 [Lithospermum erythrorhizon]